MRFKSPQEDFENTTLGAIPGLLAKLHYLARLHDGHRDYLHWGMARTYGAETARRAIRASHTAVVAEVLRTPLRVLDEDLRRSASGAEVTAGELLQSLKKLLPQALPERSLAASSRHLMAVLHALSALLENQALASLPGASRPLPPVR